MRRIAILAGLVLLPGVALAAGNGPSNPDAVFEGAAVEVADTYGTTARTFLTLPAWSARPIDSTFTYSFNNSVMGGQGISRSNTAGSPWVKVPIHVPAGAIVSEVEVNYCDTGAETLSVFWVRQAKNAGSFFTTLITSVGTPGCIVQLVTLTPNQTIDNNANSYNIEINMGGAAGSTLILGSVRVGYRLQVSPAPATATFTDVPVGSPQHRFVEALVAAGITGGCGGGLYCPNDPLTRGQMAVFLSAALGLHWPN